MPIVRVDNIRLPIDDRALGDITGNPREGGEALPVVVVISALLIHVWVSRPIEKIRSIQNERFRPQAVPDKRVAATPKRSLYDLTTVRSANAFNTSGYPGTRVRTRILKAFKAFGRDAATSASPPVCTNGKSSAETARMSMRMFLFDPRHFEFARGPLQPAPAASCSVSSRQFPAMQMRRWRASFQSFSR